VSLSQEKYTQYWKKSFITSKPNRKEIMTVIPDTQQQKPNVPAGLMQA